MGAFYFGVGSVVLAFSQRHTEDSPSNAWLPKHSGLAARQQAVSQYQHLHTSEEFQQGSADDGGVIWVLVG